MKFAHGLLLAVSTTLFAGIRVVPVDPTPEPSNVILSVVYPKNEEDYKSNPVKSQMRLRGYPLTITSEFDRSKELQNSSKGQTIRVVIDNNPYFALNDLYLYNYDQQRAFNESILNFEVPYGLSIGEHVIRAYPARSYGESLKDNGAFVARTFYVGDSGHIQRIPFDSSAPLLTYNEPQGRFTASPSDPILLDFYVSNCRLSRDGYKVKVTIDGAHAATITQWKPHFIYGLDKGSHSVQIELIDKRNKYVEGPFNKTKRLITVQ